MLPIRSIWLLAFRGLQRHQRANAAIVATLALLVAVLIAMLSLGYNLLISPWTYDTDRLGVLRHGVTGSGQERYGFAPDEYRTLRESGLFESLAASQRVPVAFGDGDGAARSMTLVRTTTDALGVTDAQPLLGRFVTADEHGNDRRIILSHALWQSDFNGDARVLGRSLLLDGIPHEIVGVMPARFHFMGGDFWSAHVADPETDPSTDTRLVLNFKARHGMSMDQVTRELTSVVERLPARSDAARYPRGWSITPLRVIDAVVGPQRPAVFLILVGAASLLMLGILNVSALLVARQIADAGTLATRKALGESRGLSVSVAFVESLMIAIASLIGAVLLGRLLFDRFVGLIAVEWIPRELEGAFRYSTPALWVLPVIALAIAAVLTLMRLRGLLRIDARSAIRGSTRSGGRRGDVAASRWLSGLQIAIAAAILISSLAIGSGAKALMKRDMGFDATSTHHTVLVFPGDRYADGTQRIAAMERFEEALQREGASATGFTDAAPMQRYTRNGVVGSATGITLDEPLPIDYHVSQGALDQALGLRLHEGRFIDSRIDHVNAEHVAVITQSLANRLAPDSSAIGMTLTAGSGNETPTARRIVGIIDDVRHESPLAPSRPAVYVPYSQDASSMANPGGQVALLVRWPNSAGSTTLPNADRISHALGRIDPWVAVREITTQTIRAERSVAGVTLARQLFAGFALLGLFLATLGVAAVAQLAVARQGHEIAVRSAIGATPRQLLASVLSGSVRVAVPAAAIGALLAWFSVDALQASLQDSAAISVSHLIMAPALLLACALAATFIPARKAAKVQPVSLLGR